ncbi:MAG: hypothetical protein GY953_49610, partial [bacterium]|nr:hypothetical protein [bacterium]
MTADRNIRSGVLVDLGAEGEVLTELLDYSEHAFNVAPEDYSRAYPLPDEESTAAWGGYARDAEEVGVFERLRQSLVQLNFPISAGISRDPTYRAAIRRGELPPAVEKAEGLRLLDPDGLRLFIHPTPAGRVPVLISAHRDDFVSLVRALTRRNEPAPIPPAVGAMMVAGYNNWERVRDYREAWEAKHPPGSWAEGFRELVP